MLKRGNPKNQRAKRALERRAPKLVENPKRSLHLFGTKASQVVKDALRDFMMMRKPDSIQFSRKNPVRPFEDVSSLEFLCRSNDCSLFFFGNHSKKRPHNLVLGRLFDFQLLDMVEVGIDKTTFKPMSAYSSRDSVIRVGSKPMFVFQGEAFEDGAEMALFKNLLLDMLQGAELTHINLAGLDHVIVCTAVDDKVYFRQYGVLMKKSGTRYPKIELEETGPHIDFTLRRHRSAPSSLRKQAMRKPRVSALTKPKRKNVEEGQFGERHGRIHMQRQDLSELELRKMKAFKKRKTASKKKKKQQSTDADGDEAM